MGLHCSHCGAINTGESPFCVNCGKELDFMGRIKELEAQLAEEKSRIKEAFKFKWRKDYTLSDLGTMIIIFGIGLLLAGFMAKIAIILVIPTACIVNVGVIIVLIARWRTKSSKK